MDQRYSPDLHLASSAPFTLLLQGFRLLSLSAYVPDSSARAASKLLRSLPLANLTALHLTGPWALSAQAAAALTAATALQELTLPGGGLGKALAAHPAVLLTGLQHLRLSDAGACSADTLRALRPADRPDTPRPGLQSSGWSRGRLQLQLDTA